MHSLCVLLPTAALAAVTSHTTIDSSAPAILTQQLSSFGVDLFATENTPAAALQHAACVMDQYLDQDRDGVADDPNVVSALTSLSAAMIMGATESDVEDVFDAIDDNGGSFGDRALQDVYASETAYYDGASYFDASLEEVLHLITQHGYANAYPSDFGEYSGTTLADAVDEVIGDCEMSWECGDGDEDEDGDDAHNTDDANVASGEAFCEESGFSKDECKSYDSSACECDWDGGQCWWQGGACGGRRLDEGCEDYSDGSWVQGSCSGKFHYSDTTCDYGCLITEGLYWGVSSLLGAQEDRCNSIDDEWEPCTPALMRSDAPALSTLIDTMGITVLPDGNCDVTNDLDAPMPTPKPSPSPTAAPGYCCSTGDCGVCTAQSTVQACWNGKDHCETYCGIWCVGEWQEPLPPTPSPVGTPALAASPDADGAAGHRVGLCLVFAALFVLLATADALSNDLDGDGVEDVAPEGSCCISQYGVGFDTACGSTLAEVTANCCPSPFVARYHLGFGGEETTSYDCVSFISKEDCNSYGMTWSGGDDDPIGLGQMGGCPHSVAFYATTENDLDGDGVADAAAEGDCCINGYGASFADSSCGNTLAEVTANCCWSPFVARYSIQPDGENQNAFDCVSFISEEDCNALGALWSDDSQIAGQCQHSADATTDDNAAATDDNYGHVPATTTNWGSGAGWCYSSLDREIGSATGDDCWALCEATYGSSLVAVDWNGASECYCQSACECLMDVGDSDGYLMTVDSITALPDECPASYNDEDDGSSWCGDRRDCNAPAAYSSLTVNDDNEPLYVQSTGFPAALRAGAETGVDLTRNMLGTASDTRIYLLEPNGADDVYSALIDDYCDFVGWDWSECGESEVSAAQSGGGQYYLSGKESCVCGEYTYAGAPMFMMPSTSDDATMVAERAIHEYTHVVQKASGGPMADWLMEGGAVFNECWLGPELSGSYYSSFSQCFQYGGGGGGILNNVRQLYLDDPSVPWFTLWANDRCCGDDCPPTHGEGQGMQDRYIYYDLGAFAVAMAITRADAKFGRGAATIHDFWTSAERGFWRRTDIPYGPIDHVNGWPSDVPDCVEINQCVGCTRQFFTKSFLGDDAAVLAWSSGEEPASPRHRAGVASMAWRTTRRCSTNAP